MRFQAAAKSLDANLHHLIRSVDKPGLNGLIDYARIFRFEIDRHGCLSVLRVTLHAAGRLRREFISIPRVRHLGTASARAQSRLRHGAPSLNRTSPWGLEVAGSPLGTRQTTLVALCLDKRAELWLRRTKCCHLPW